ncbi:hypothetical protein ACFLWO_02035 [Chloroflexota bacterium]
MVWISKVNVDEIWQKIKESVEKGELGIALWFLAQFPTSQPLVSLPVSLSRSLNDLRG